MDADPENAVDHEKPKSLHQDVLDINHAADIAVAIAYEVDNKKFSPWTASMFQLYMILFVAYCCGCLNGGLPERPRTHVRID